MVALCTLFRFSNGKREKEESPAAANYRMSNVRAHSPNVSKAARDQASSYGKRVEFERPGRDDTLGCRRERWDTRQDVFPAVFSRRR